MPTDLSPPGTRHAAGSASGKCHARSDFEDPRAAAADAALGAGKILVSGSGSQGSNETPNRGWAAGGLEGCGDQSEWAKGRTRGRHRVRTTGADGNFVDRVRA